MTTLRLRPQKSQTSQKFIRKVNLRTDLAALADLIELAFANVMDASGRGAIQELRALNAMGLGLVPLARFNGLASGISNGFVWEEDGKIVGNVSLYPAKLRSKQPSTWIVANVATHPAYQRRGIAYELMQHSLRALKQEKIEVATLQVDYKNEGAQKLYARLGFEYESAWKTWRRTYSHTSARVTSDLYRARSIKASEWEKEWEVVAQRRPNDKGGIGWMIPTELALIQPPFWKRVMNLLSLSQRQAYVSQRIHSKKFESVLWAEKLFGYGYYKLTFFPSIIEEANESVLHYALSQHDDASFIIEHPYFDVETNRLLEDYRFKVNREMWHMTLNLKA
ncbi:hypothetical protein MASR2M15_07800 [Anaerolineales bacterium]